MTNLWEEWGLTEPPRPDAIHACEARHDVYDAAQGAELTPSPREWGEAIGAIVLIGGIWWAVARDADVPEYCTPIRYCPWCGEDLVEPLISARSLAMMDASMASLDEGEVGEPLDPDAMLSASEEESSDE